MNYPVFGRLSCLCSIRGAFLNRTVLALGWARVLFALLFGTTENLFFKTVYPARRLKRQSRWLAKIAILWCLAEGIAAAQVSITQPANGSTVSGSTQLCASWNAPPVQWINFYVDGIYLNSSPPNCVTWNASGLSGQHQISVAGFNGYFLASAAITVSVANSGDPSGTTISALTGSASGIPGADTNPGDYGNYAVSWNGVGVMGGPLLNDAQAAQQVVATATSNTENNAYGTASQNAAANNYFNNIAQNNPSDYLNQLSSFQSAYQGNPWQPAVQRVDGACPMTSPTTAEVIQWAANKWGIHPELLYAIVTNESHWDQTALNDHGGGAQDAGIFQVADRGATHAYPGFSGYGQNLARENTCFNADFFAAWLYGAYTGLVGARSDDVGTAIESWSNTYATSPDGYASTVWGILGAQDWIAWDFNGQSVAY